MNDEMEDKYKELGDGILDLIDGRLSKYDEDGEKLCPLCEKGTIVELSENLVCNNEDCDYQEPI